MREILICTAIAFFGLLSSAAADDCAPLPGWESVAGAAAGKYLIFGETHGSTESPQAFGEYACAASLDGPTLVAVEFGAVSDAGLQLAWATSPEDFRTALMDNVPELSIRRDGVGSVAMVDMLARLHTLKSAGRPIDIVAFNGARDKQQTEKFAHLPGQEPHEAAQAENIRIASAQKDYTHLLILVGNLHATKGKVGFGERKWEPMAMKLAAPENIISLHNKGGGGETWNCTLKPGATREEGKPFTPDDIECGAHRVSADPGWSGAPRMGLWTDSDNAEEGYDGYYFLGPVTASPPAGDAISQD